MDKIKFLHLIENLTWPDRHDMDVIEENLDILLYETYQAGIEESNNIKNKEQSDYGKPI